MRFQKLSMGRRCKDWDLKTEVISKLNSLFTNAKNAK
jgi:hypothetical protein